MSRIEEIKNFIRMNFDGFNYAQLKVAELELRKMAEEKKPEHNVYVKRVGELINEGKSIEEIMKIMNHK